MKVKLITNQQGKAYEDAINKAIESLESEDNIIIGLEFPTSPELNWSVLILYKKEGDKK